MAKVGIRDVARAAEVSTATVSYVLNNSRRVSAATRQRVLDAASALGYRPNVNGRSLQSKRSYLFGYSWRPLPPKHASPILDRFIHSMGIAAYRAGYHLLAFPSPNDQDEVDVYRELVGTRRVDGIVLNAVNLNDPRLAYLIQTDMPFVAFGRPADDYDYPWVEVDGRAGVRLAVEHLAAQGHRRIAILAWPEDSLPGRQRLLGYLDGMAAMGEEPREVWIQRVHHDATEGFQGGMRLLSLPPDQRPTAIVCVSDLIALGALNAVLKLNLRAGRDVGIIGFDDIPVADHLHPPLTSVRQPVDEVGALVIKQLTTLIREGTLPDEERHLLLEPTLIVRESSLREALPA